MIMHKRNRSNSIVEINDESKITKFIERPDQEIGNTKQNWVNSGLYSFSKKILKYIPAKQFCDFPRDIFPVLVSRGCLYGYKLKGYRCSIDTPARYEKAQNDPIQNLDH